MSDPNPGAKPKSKVPAARLTAVFAACATAAAMVVHHEGWVTKTYPDPIGKLTACAGVTENVQAGRTYGDEACIAMTAQALVKHGVDIDPCIKVELPVKTHAAFVSFAYNVGKANFCSSTLIRKANAGDLAGACAELSRWVYAGGKVFPGLVRRRAEERALCEAGVREGR
ncbi:MAG: lysozyme [Pseudomonadota bacterium]